METFSPQLLPGKENAEGDRADLAVDVVAVEDKAGDTSVGQVALVVTG